MSFMLKKGKVDRESLGVDGRIVLKENMQWSLVAKNVFSVAFLKALSK